MQSINAQQLFMFMLISGFFMPSVAARSYYMENITDSIIGELDSVVVNRDRTLLDIAREYGLGYQDIKLLNPGVDTWLPNDGQLIQLPLKFILPDVPRAGIVLNIPEMRLYYFPLTEQDRPTEKKVITYPLGIGRAGWETPYQQTRIIGKRKYPDWHPPASIRKEHEEAGDPLPDIVMAGPDNPLGDYALRLGIPAYLIHGTNKPWGIGMRVSHGCIRLYPEDIAELFSQVKVGTRVNIINMPYKVGKQDGILYLEVHPPLAVVNRAEAPYAVADVAGDEATVNDFEQVVVMIMQSIRNLSGEYEMDWGLIRIVYEEARGLPIAIGIYTEPG